MTASRLRHLKTFLSGVRLGQFVGGLLYSGIAAAGQQMLSDERRAVADERPSVGESHPRLG